MENNGGSVKKVMIIDDENTCIDLLSFFLKKAGFSPVGFTDGHEALKNFAAGGFDFVITDMHMPKITGLEVITQLKNLNHDIPIAVITGFTDHSEAQLRERGALGVFSKPINFPEITHLIKTKLSVV